eukprot:TRINITY_DN26199_c0_g1_i1.p1 TRINITY_DN26199_c0_g1~~TRINITY_DN26199_c0_g1_i1.p1  ORF type:complete len:398 (+),score=88.42 TRINITY_DN26199_c0_g1_i1:123-1316(+)
MLYARSFISLLACLASQTVALGSGAGLPLTKIIGYFDAKSQKELPVESVPYQNLTHVVLTNAVKVDNQGNIILSSGANSTDLSAEELIKHLVALPVKVIVSLRGHEDDVALDELSEVDDIRTRFVAKMATKLTDWGADGVEIEWHSDDPLGGKASAAPFDKMEQYHFALLCRDLRSALRSSGDKTLSVAVRPGRKELAEGVYVKKFVDWLVLRAYSMRSLGDPHHSSMKDMAAAIEEWESKGVPNAQLVVGTALFGRPGASLNSVGDRNEALRLPWKDLAARSHFVPSRGDHRGDSFQDIASGKGWWISGVNTTKSKMEYILKNGYGGLALRDLHHDVVSGSLSLLEAANEAVKDYKIMKRRSGFLTRPLALLQRSLTHSKSEGTSADDDDDPKIEL